MNLVTTELPLGMDFKPQPKARLALIDVAKGLGILLIVLGHNPLFSSNQVGLSEILASFRIPFFFFISGATFSVGNRSVFQVAYLRADAWLKPTLVVTLLFAVRNIAVGKETVESLILEITYLTGFTFSVAALWFLPHLWLLYVSSTALLTYGKKFLEKNSQKVLLLISLGISGYYCLDYFDSVSENKSCKMLTSFNEDLFKCGLPLSADMLLLTAFFFLSGHFLSKQVKTFRPNFKVFLLSLFGLITLYTTFEYSVNLNFREYDSLFVSHLQAFCGIYSMLTLCYALSKAEILVKTLTRFGRASLIILLFHAPILFKLVYILPQWIHSPFLISLIVFIVPVVSCMLIYSAIKRSKLLSLLFLPRRIVFDHKAAQPVSSPAPLI